MSQDAVLKMASPATLPNEALKTAVVDTSCGRWQSAVGAWSEVLALGEVPLLASAMLADCALRCGELEIAEAHQATLDHVLQGTDFLERHVSQCATLRDRRSRIVIPESLDQISHDELRTLGRDAVSCHYWAYAAEVWTRFLMNATGGAQFEAYKRIASCHAALGHHRAAILHFEEALRIRDNEQVAFQLDRSRRLERRQRESATKHVSRLGSHPVVEALQKAYGLRSVADTALATLIAGELDLVSQWLGADLLGGLPRPVAASPRTQSASQVVEVVPAPTALVTEIVLREIPLATLAEASALHELDRPADPPAMPAPIETLGHDTAAPSTAAEAEAQSGPGDPGRSELEPAQAALGAISLERPAEPQPDEAQPAITVPAVAGPAAIVSPAGPIRVLSIVANSILTDARVMKQAKALQRAGCEVCILGRLEDDEPPAEEVGGLKIRRFKTFDLAIPVTPQARDEAMSSFGVLQTEIAHRLAATSTARTAKEEMRWYLEVLRTQYKTAAADKTKRAGTSSDPKLIKDKIIKVSEELRQIGAQEAAVRTEAMFHLRYYLFTAHALQVDLDFTPDVIHSHDLYTLPAAIAISRRTGAKVIWDAHEIETERVPPLAPERKDFVNRLEHLLFKSIDHLIVCCDSAADFYHQRFPVRRPVVVMNAPEIRDGVPGSKNVREMANLADDTKVLIYTGGVGREGRGLHIVTEALQHLADWHLVILGPRHEGNDEWLLEHAQRFGVTDRLHLLAPVPADQVVSAIRTANVGVCLIQDVSLSYRYAMPNKLFEMAFGGTPLCVSDLPEMSRFVKDVGVGEPVDEKDPVKVAQMIEHLYTNAADYGLSEHGRQRLTEYYSWPAQTRKLRDAYMEIL